MPATCARGRLRFVPLQAAALSFVTWIFLRIIGTEGVYRGQYAEACRRRKRQLLCPTGNAAGKRNRGANVK
ncbi:MAG: hypothetical protein IKC65_03645 [Lentisphaeria bacterium]|nr:hypothetical protein [Lentisphaeria bacterium]